MKRIELTKQEESARKRTCLALDVPTVLVIESAITNAGNKYDKDGNKKVLVAKGTMEDRRRVTYETLQAMAKNL